MQTQELFTVTLEPDLLECWANKSTTSALRALRCGFIWQDFRSVKQLALSNNSVLFGRTKRCFSAFIGLVRRVRPSAGVAVDETGVQIGTDQRWLYAVIDTETKILLGVFIAVRRGTDPTAEFLGRLAEKLDLHSTFYSPSFSSTGVNSSP